MTTRDDALDWAGHHQRIQQMQSKAGTHHGDAVEAEDRRLQQHRECLDLAKQLQVTALALKDHLKAVGMVKPSGDASYAADLAREICDQVALAAFRLKGTI